MLYNIFNSFKRLFGSIETYRKEIEEIEQVMRTLKSPLVFCHNDLLSGNLIYNQKRGQTHSLLLSTVSVVGLFEQIQLPSLILSMVV